MNQLRIFEFAAQGDLAGVRSELDKGVAADARVDETQDTPLMAAVRSGDASPDVLHLLIQRGANVNAIAREEMPSLQQAFDLLEKAMANSPAELGIDPELMQRLRSIQHVAPNENITVTTALTLAASCGDPEKVRVLLDAGADIHFQTGSGYEVFIHALTGRSIVRDDQLGPLVELLIARGANVNATSQWNETPLRFAAREARFDIARLLLKAGAEPATLAWTPLMRAIALGAADEVKMLISAGGEDLTARDWWEQTPFLLSLRTGELAKARLLLDAGSDRAARGRDGYSPLCIAIHRDDAAMLQWLLSEGFDANELNGMLKQSPLMYAMEMDAITCCKVLLENGTDVNQTDDAGHTAMTMTENVRMARLLLAHGADLQDANAKLRAKLTQLPRPNTVATTEEYRAGKHRQFGNANPEKMHVPFWQDMVLSGQRAYAARQKFEDHNLKDGAVWCFHRFGMSFTELPDGRFLQIAGEHEDSYDPDFCIYNDVIMHHPDGTFDIYGYPEDCFPPTDFHTATLVGSELFLIGNLGYVKDRRPGQAQVYRLDIHTLQISPVITTGDCPGWISEHRAKLIDRCIRIIGGQIYEKEGCELQKNNSIHELDLPTLTWRCLITNA